jgi:hypothetical protein
MDKIGSWYLKISAICVIYGSEKGPLRLPCLVFFFSVALCLCVRNFNSRQRAGIAEGGSRNWKLETGEWKEDSRGDAGIAEGEKLLISFLFIL